MTDVQIRPLDLVAQMDEALAIEAAALERPADDARRQGYLRHATYPGFAALGAMQDDRLVGFGYGHTGEPGQWWHDDVAVAMAAAGHGAWLADAFVLVELHVLPEFQARGIGRSLLTQLLRGRHEQRALLSAHDLETPARRLYRQVGFVELLTGYRFAGADRAFVVMGARLPLAQAS